MTATTLIMTTNVHLQLSGKDFMIIVNVNDNVAHVKNQIFIEKALQLYSTALWHLLCDHSPDGSGNLLPAGSSGSLTEGTTSTVTLSPF